MACINLNNFIYDVQLSISRIISAGINSSQINYK